MTIQWKSPLFREAAKVSAPSFFGMGAWGIVVGIAMIKAGLSVPQALGMTLIVFAGSAQLAALPLIVSQAPIWVIFVTALIVNLRFLIMSALIAPRFAHLPWPKRTALGFLTGDLTVALFMQRFPDMWQTPSEAEEQTTFLHGLLAPTWLIWQIGSILGIFVGNQVPLHWGLGFAGSLAILCLVLPMVQNRAALAGVLVASVVALLAHDLPYQIGLLLAVLFGMASAKWAEEHAEPEVISDSRNTIAANSHKPEENHE